jgi:hypothetical protein
MAKAFRNAKTLLVAGAMAASVIGFAGVASAATPDQTCWGQIPAGSAHKPFSHATPGEEGCGNHDDTSKTSMADMASAGSYKDNNPAIAVSPWTKAHKAA